MSKEDFKKQEWWIQLVDECKAIMVERGFSARVEVVTSKWEIGERISLDKNYEKFAKGSGNLVGELSELLVMAPSDLYDCIRFFQKFPESVSTALESLGKDMSWSKIREEHLGDGDQQPRLKEPRYKLSEVEVAFKNWFTKSAVYTPSEFAGEWKKFSNLLK